MKEVLDAATAIKELIITKEEMIDSLNKDIYSLRQTRSMLLTTKIEEEKQIG